MTPSETHWNGVERKSSGLEENINALERKRIELRRRCFGWLSEGSEERGNGKAMSCMAMAYQRIVMAMNGQEWLRKSYEGKSFATEIPLKRL